MRVYEFDTTAHAGHVVFDFAAKPGDTVGVRNQGTKVTIALGGMRFAVGTLTYAIRDSIGVVSWYDSRSKPPLTAALLPLCSPTRKLSSCLATLGIELEAGL